MPSPRSQPPRILVASHHTDVALDLQQVAERRGYVVRRAYTGVQLLDLRFTADTDVVVLDESLPDIEPLDASRALRTDPRVGPGVPILLLSADHPTAARHHAALRAGIWQYLAHPFDPEELAARLDRFVFLKRDADRAREQSPVTDETGLYTMRGLALRAQELGLQAFHHAEPLLRRPRPDHPPGLERRRRGPRRACAAHRRTRLGRDRPGGPGRVRRCRPRHRPGGSGAPRRAHVAGPARGGYGGRRGRGAEPACRLRRGRERALHLSRAQEPARPRHERAAHGESGRRPGVDPGLCLELRPRGTPNVPAPRRPPSPPLRFLACRSSSPAAASSAPPPASPPPPPWATASSSSPRRSRSPDTTSSSRGSRCTSPGCGSPASPMCTCTAGLMPQRAPRSRCSRTSGPRSWC